MGEKWRRHPTMAFLDVSASGLLRMAQPLGRRKRGEIVHQAPVDIKGKTYMRATFMYDRYSVHRLVAETWVPRPSEAHCETHHLNHDGTDNRAENLVWLTKADHRRATYLSGENVGPRGEAAPAAKLTEDRVRLLRILHKFADVSYKDLAAAVGLTPAGVRHAVTGRNWSHVA